MSDAAPFPDRPTRAAALAARRRRRLRLGAIAVASAVGATLFGLVATDTLGVRGKRPTFGDERAAADIPPSAAIDFTAGQLDDTEHLPPTRPISHDDPLRVWMGGDSHVGVVGRSLGELLSSTGVVSLTYDYRVSSGLLGGPRDWVEYAPGAVASSDPEIAIFMIGTNDAVVWSSDRAGFYREQVTRMMDTLSNGGQRLVLWVGTPTLGRSAANADAAEINSLVREIADARDEVIFVDAFDVFDDGAGGYTPDLQSLDGVWRRMRNGDGVHFTEAGGQLLASVLFAILDRVWSITDQADPDNPIGFTTAPGSGCDGPCGAGTYDPGDSYGSSGTDPTSDTSTAPEETAVDPAPTTTTLAPVEETTTSAPEPPPPSSSTTTTTAAAPTTSAAPSTTKAPEPPASAPQGAVVPPLSPG
jgi:hypothetical protein